MNIERPRIKATVDQATGAVLEFKELRSNVREQLNHALRTMLDDSIPVKERNDNNDKAARMILQSCVSVDGIFEDGVAITVEDIHAAALYEQTIGLICASYWAALAKGNKPEAEAKNASDGGESQPA
jgi:hypothetical protein